MDSQVQTWHRTLLVGSITLVSLAAWIMLWRFGAVLHGPVHHVHAGRESSFLLLFVGSWTMMTMAMMLPTAVPLIATFQTIAGARPDRSLLIALVIVGYLATWAGVGMLFYGGGVLAQGVAANNAWLGARSSAGGGLLLLVAGLYQFTPWKYRCLDKCRSPLSFVLGHWRGEHERRNAVRLGVHHGLFCVGCCWVLMLLLFVGGVMNILWIAAITLFVLLEMLLQKNPLHYRVLHILQLQL